MSDRLEAIRAAAHAELARQPRTRSWWVDALQLACVNLVFGAGAALVLDWNSTQHTSAALRYLSAAALCVVSLLGAVLAVRPRARALRLAVIGLALTSIAAVLAAASGFDPGMLGAGCGVSEGLLSLVPLVAATVILSRFAFDASRTIVGGLAAGAGGMLALHLHCPIGTLSHLALFHVLPWLAVAGVTLLVRSRLTSRSAAP